MSLREFFGPYKENGGEVSQICQKVSLNIRLNVLRTVIVKLKHILYLITRSKNLPHKEKMPKYINFKGVFFQVQKEILC